MRRHDKAGGTPVKTQRRKMLKVARRRKSSIADATDRIALLTLERDEALEQQRATSEVLKVISRSAFDLSAVLNTLVESAARLCEADMASVPRLTGTIFDQVASYGYSPDFHEFMRRNPILPGRGTAAGRAVAEGKTIHIPDVLADPEYDYAGGQKVGGFRTLLGVPLMREGAAIGALVLGRSISRPFTPEQIELVETFADQAVIAIENTRLFNEVRQRTEDLSESLEQQTATADLLQVISRSAFDLQPIFDAIAERAVRLCGADRAFIFRFDNELLYMVAAYNAPADFKEWVAQHPIRPGRHSGSARAALERRTIHIHDVRADPEYTYGAKDAEEIRTVLGVPILKGDELLGVMMIYHLEGVRPFTEKQIALVETFADQAAIAIENVRLFNEVQAKSRDLTEALTYQTGSENILRVIASSPTDVAPVLKAIVETACELCDASDALVFLKDGEDLRFSAHHGSIPIDLEKWPINRNWVTGRAVVDRVPVQVHDLPSEGDDFPEGRELARHQGHRTVLSVPLLREGESIGAISLRRTEVQPFSDKQIALLQTFADQAVIAIGNVRLFEQLQERTKELSKSLDDLRTAQDRLIQTEKLASLGQLTAGIAHEIKNPLNFVNNFAALSVELTGELKDALKPATLADKIRTEVEELTGLLKDNLDKVVQHGKRADSIVKNMLQHSREGSGEHRPADINAIVDESLNLAYHGARAEKAGFSIVLQRDFDPSVGMADVYPQEITRVLLNLISNAFYATTKRKVEAGDGFEPMVSAATKNLGDKVEIRIRDNGTGIPEGVKEKIFNPFFTTKPTGEGTGLGLSMSHDIIVKQHGGSIDVETEPGQFTEFKIVLPRTSRK